MINHAGVDVTIEIGQAVMPLRSFLSLGRGAVVTLRLPDEGDVVVRCGERVIAPGAVVVEDGRVSVELLPSNAGVRG